jgi:uncharacterized protein
MSQEIAAAFSFGIIAAFLLVIATRRGFFTFSPLPWIVPIRFTHVIGGFAIYFVMANFFAAALVTFFQDQMIGKTMLFASWLNFFVSLSIFAALLLFLQFVPKEVRSGIFQRPGEHHFFLKQFSTALYAWVLSFPLVLAVGQAIEALLFKLFGITHLPDQMAVRFLKATFDEPLHFLLAIGTIVILAPLVEETLFRGLLQTYIRRHLGSRQAIVITSLCFALFHYAAGQELSNVSIIGSLFVLALFLGFLYEKQGTIVAPMLLHASFNGISVLNLYLFGGFSPGL